MGEVPPGAVCYLEIPAPDLGASKSFYSAAFGWELADSEVEGMKYTIFTTGGISGGLDPRRKPSREGVLLYIKCADIDAALASVVTAGGKSVKAKSPVVEGRDFGVFALFDDPCGNRLGLWAAK